MQFLFAALISGSLVTSLHSTEEECLGRQAVVLRDAPKATSVQCVPMYPRAVTSSQVLTCSTGAPCYTQSTGQIR